jgi:hypothetical protein
LSKSSNARERQETSTNMSICQQTVVDERDFLTTETHIDRNRKHIILNAIRDKICGGKIRATVSHNRVPYTVLHVSNILRDTKKYNVILPLETGEPHVALLLFLMDTHMLSYGLSQCGIPFATTARFISPIKPQSYRYIRSR